jgi:hypothetical protein
VEGSIPDLTRVKRGLGGLTENWNDEISSIIVTRGRFRFFEHVEFGGAWKELGPGRYPWCPDVGIPDNTISSIEMIE